VVELSIINFDVSVLGGHYNAKYGIGSSSFGTSAASFASRGPAVVTPWAEEDDRSLLSRYNQIRSKSTFINENTSAVKAAGFDKDDKALFTLYSALNDLKTIAEYAKDDKTSSSLIAGLSTKFQSGLAEIDAYVRAVELDKLILMAGEKKSYVTTTAVMGKNDRDIEGQVISASETAALSSLNGDEVFTISISDGFEAAEDVVIDLSAISGDLSLSNIKNHINSKISEITELNGDGETVSKYKSRIQIEEYEDGKFGFKFDVNGTEQLSFSAASAGPALILTGTNKSSDYGSIETGTLTKYDTLDGSGLSKKYTQEIVGIDANGFVIPASADDADGEDIKSTPIKFETTPTAVAVDSHGNSYVVGTTEGDFGTQINGAQTSDVFLSKFDSTGNLLWSRLVGASDEAEAFGITVDADDNVIIAGKTNEELVTADVFGGTDSFITKYAVDGEELWTRQLDTISTDQANSLTTDANGDVYFIGQVSGRFDTTTTDNGGTDAVIVKLGSASGTVLATSQYGSAANDYGKEIAIADDGNLLVVAEEDGNAVLRKLDKDNLESTLATYDLGDLAGGKVTGISVVGTEIYISGSTLNGSLNGGTVSSSYSGGKDGFVTKLSDGGSGFSADWTAYLGTVSSDSIADIKVTSGAVYVAGTTGGTLSGETRTGLTDGFTAKLDGATGALDWQQQLGGTAGYNTLTGLAVAENGSSVLDVLGLPTGTVNNTQTRDVETQTSLRAGDHFYISVNGGRDIKIDIREGDTFDRLATRINTYSTRNLKASVTSGPDGPALKLQANNGAEVEFKAGADGRDALSKLGLEERSIIASEVLFDLDDDKGIDPEDLGGVFALGLNSAFSFSTRQEAEYIFNQLENAIQTIQSAHRSLTFDPIRAQILEDAKKNIGPAPAHLQDRLARYQDGLQRVLAVTGGTYI
tara:strand:+ start:182216 stop:184990 length:2775 start_codon:yes stop_codon:yes gene_type:complete